MGKSNSSVKKTKIEAGDLTASSLMAAGQSENGEGVLNSMALALNPGCHET